MLNSTWETSLTSGQRFLVPACDHGYVTVSNVCIPEFNKEFSKQPSRLFAHIKRSNGQIETSLVATLIPFELEHSVTSLKISPLERCELELKGPHQIDVIGYTTILPFEEEEDINNSEEEEKSENDPVK